MLGKESFDSWYAHVTDEERKELESVKNDPEEIKDRFGAPLAFGTAGMRGVVGLGTFRMNNYTVARATAGLAEFICLLGENAKKKRGGDKLRYTEIQSRICKKSRLRSQRV